MRMEPPEGGSTMFEYDAVLNSVFLNFYGTLWSEGKLDQATKEVERIRSARAVGCETCRNLRFSGAQEQGLTEDDVDLLEDGYAESDLSPWWKAALVWSDAVTGAPRVDAPEAAERRSRGVPPNRSSPSSRSRPVWRSCSRRPWSPGARSRSSPSPRSRRRLPDGSRHGKWDSTTKATPTRSWCSTPTRPLSPDRSRSSRRPRR